jgi:hypothetical protein
MNARRAARIRAAFNTVRTDREEMIALKRDATVLPEQPFRVELSGRSATRLDSESGDEHRIDAILLGQPQADVLIGDRFLLNDTLYRVIMVHPNRQMGTQAECEMVDGPVATLPLWVDADGEVITDEQGRPFVLP